MMPPEEPTNKNSNKIDTPRELLPSRIEDPRLVRLLRLKEDKSSQLLSDKCKTASRELMRTGPEKKDFKLELSKANQKTKNEMLPHLLDCTKIGSLHGGLIYEVISSITIL